MQSIQNLLIENSNRPEVQAEIRKHAIEGARDAGFNIILGYDNKPAAGTKHTYENWEAAITAAKNRVAETVDLD